MRFLRPLVVALLPLQAALAQSQAGQPAANRDLDLETRVEARRAEVIHYLRPDAQKRVTYAVRSMIERIRSGHAGDLAELGRKQATARFGKLRPQQTDMLAFLIVAETVRTLAQPDKVDEALRVESQVDMLQAAQLTEILQKESALMSAAAVLLQWVANVEGQVLSTVK